MTRVNLDSSLIEERERISRKILRSEEIFPSNGPDPDIYEMSVIPYSFKIKRPIVDARSAVYGYMNEEGIRQSWFYPFLKQETTVFDIGANHGSWTLPALALGARVYAFEPDPRWCKSLTDSVNINPGFGERFTLIEKAVAHQDLQSVSFDELEDVPCISVDTFVKESGVKPDYIKIDTEGMEYRIIQGASRTLEQTHPRIVIEHHLLVGGVEMENAIKQMLSEFKYMEIGQRTEYMSRSLFFM